MRLHRVLLAAAVLGTAAASSSGTALAHDPAIAELLAIL
jgi:hypothetical protein